MVHHPASEHPISAPVKRRARGYIVAVALGVGLSLLGLTTASSRLPSARDTLADAGRALPVSSRSLQPQPSYTVQSRFVGRVEAARESAIGFELAGLLRAVLVDEGDTVTAGQVLARLDQARLQAQRRELQAGLAQAEAERALARITVQRLAGVVGAGGVSRQGLDEAREAHRAAQAAVVLARSRIETIEVDLSKTQLLAPFDGVVTQRLADEGQVLAAGQPVLQVMERRRPKIRIGVAGTRADTLTIGQDQVVEVHGRAFPARVEAVLAVRGSGTRTVDVILALEGTPSGLRPGDLATLTLRQNIPEPGYWLPIEAFAEGPRGLWTVYRLEPIDGPSEPVVGATHAIVTHTVEILHQEAERAFVRGTLPPGARVVTGGLHRIVPGQRVRLAEATDTHVAQGSTRHVSR